MGKVSDAEIDNLKLGKKLIETALKIEDSLAEILAVQVAYMKNLYERDINEEMLSTSKLLKNIICLLIMTDERIIRGLELCGITTKPNTSKPSWLATDDPS